MRKKNECPKNITLEQGKWTWKRRNWLKKRKCVGCKLVVDLSRRLEIYSSGVLQGEQGAHQSFLFLNKQGGKREKEGTIIERENSGDGREENAPLGKVFHCQRSLSSRDLQRKPFCPLRGELTITEQKHGGDFISISKGWMIIVPGAIWQHFPSLQLHRQPIHSCQNSLVQVQFSYHHPDYLWDSEVHNHSSFKYPSPQNLTIIITKLCIDIIEWPGTGRDSTTKDWTWKKFLRTGQKSWSRKVKKHLEATVHTLLVI